MYSLKTFARISLIFCRLLRNSRSNCRLDDFTRRSINDRSERKAASTGSEFRQMMDCTKRTRERTKKRRVRDSKFSRLSKAIIFTLFNFRIRGVNDNVQLSFLSITISIDKRNTSQMDFATINFVPTFSCHILL